MKKVCYLRVLPEYDEQQTYVSGGKVYRLKRKLVRNQLLTLTEAFNLNVPMSWLQIVKVEYISVYYFGDVRFCIYYRD